MIPKKVSTMLSQEPLVGVKCNVIGDCARARHDLGVGVGAVVITHHMQILVRVGIGDLLDEAQEFLMAVPGIAGVGDLAGGYLQRGEQCGGAVPKIAMGLARGQSGEHW
jgi:hypothetical protein